MGGAARAIWFLFLVQSAVAQERTIWIDGSANVIHDQRIADSIVGAKVRFGLWCTSDTALSTANDILFSARADSYNRCSWAGQRGLSLIGGGNFEEFVGDKKDPNSIFISNGGAYGKRVDFFVNKSNLGDAFVRTTNWLIIQEPMSVSEMRRRLTGEPKYIDGRYVGIEASKLQPPPDVTFLPPILYLLLE